MDVLFREAQSRLMFRQGLARFLELLPVRCEFQSLVVLCERLFGVALRRKYVAPEFPGVSIMRAERRGLGGGSQ